MLLALLALLLALAGTPARAADRYAAIVMDAATGEVLHAEDADQKLYPASLTKMMTLYLTFQAIDRGKLSLGQRIRISKHAAGQAPSKLGLPAGATIRVEDAIYALVTKSANDIAVALGEAISGSETRFAAEMTEQARKLGMKNTTFRNANGLPNRRQISTARDMAVLARALLRDYPEHYHFFGAKRWSYRGTTYRNHNRLMDTYPGMDGFKTGYIRASGFNLVASAVRGRLRLIAVVFGGSTAQRRDARVAALLDQAFESKRGRYLIANGTSTVGPFEPPLPVRRPTEVAAASELSIAPEPSIASLAAAAIAEAMTPEMPVPPTRPAAIQSGRDDLSLVALSAEESALVEEGIGGDLPAANWGIQVGAFSDTAAGTRAMAMARSLVPDLLAGAEPQLMEVHTRQGRLYRARLTGLDQDSATLACNRMVKVGTPCLTIAPDGE